MTFPNFDLTTIAGESTTLSEVSDRVTMVVNVASKCGFTPQYEALQELQNTYQKRGFTVLGFPCNLFMMQEPGGAEQIVEFCSATYGVDFPLFEKTHVNGRAQHPLYAELVKTPDASGKAGRVKWNFEKFVIGPDGDVHRFRSRTAPDDPAIIALIEEGVNAKLEVA
ncbi:glutathione peroxidase [Homoserinimonas sp. OAct 916]|uniref:glutathione peroxidase n=1 Tax=Homoserinimonas sp. OAct 916 TaxID=2211450 RepID=UPI000DBE9991|nr:redoxin domain-containing protein [Homoserinimonas sp. OAct 916]